MLLSETDAKTKQCRVMPPVPANVSHTLNGLNPAPWPMSCAASACMHWRWGDPLRDEEPIRERRGFCGLAGRP